MRGAKTKTSSKMSSMVVQNMDENKNNLPSKIMTRSVIMISNLLLVTSCPANPDQVKLSACPYMVQER
jgi:hypothetical protein